MCNYLIYCTAVQLKTKYNNKIQNGGSKWGIIISCGTLSIENHRCKYLKKNTENTQDNNNCCQVQYNTI